MREVLVWVEVAWRRQDLMGQCFEVCYWWETPDGRHHQHRVESDMDLSETEIEAMRQTIQDRCNIGPFG